MHLVEKKKTERSQILINKQKKIRASSFHRGQKTIIYHNTRTLKRKSEKRPYFFVVVVRNDWDLWITSEGCGEKMNLINNVWASGSMKNNNSILENFTKRHTEVGLKSSVMEAMIKGSKGWHKIREGVSDWGSQR